MEQSGRSGGLSWGKDGGRGGVAAAQPSFAALKPPATMSDYLWHMEDLRVGGESRYKQGNNTAGAAVCRASLVRKRPFSWNGHANDFERSFCADPLITQYPCRRTRLVPRRIRPWRQRVRLHGASAPGRRGGRRHTVEGRAYDQRLCSRRCRWCAAHCPDLHPLPPAAPLDRPRAADRLRQPCHGRCTQLPWHRRCPPRRGPATWRVSRHRRHGGGIPCAAEPAGQRG